MLKDLHFINHILYSFSKCNAIISESLWAAEIFMPKESHFINHLIYFFSMCNVLAY